MTKAERDKEYEGVYYEETDIERIARIDKAKKEAATRMAAQAARKAAQKAARVPVTKRADILQNKGSQNRTVPGGPQNGKNNKPSGPAKGAQAAMPSNPYFL